MADDNSRGRGDVASGDHGFAIGLVVFYVVAATAAYVWSGGKGDVAAIMRVGGDERQRSMDRDRQRHHGHRHGAGGHHRRHRRHGPRRSPRAIRPPTP